MFKSLVTVAVALSLGVGGIVASPCLTKIGGKAAGEWQRPSTCTLGSGFMMGKLADDTGQGVFLIAAKLVRTPSPCLSCEQGLLVGNIIDPNTGKALFAVQGNWSGSTLGTGTFSASILSIPPTPSPPIKLLGKIAGSYKDVGFGCPDPVGKFEGEWSICF